MVRHRALIGLVSLVVLAGCELSAVDVAPPTATVVVHAVLNPDAAEQVLLVESSLTGRATINDTVRFNASDPIRTAGGVPISNADVRLLPDADTVGVQATESQLNGRGTGRYVVPRATLAIVPGRAYRLRIRTVEGLTVTGETLVPSAPADWVPGVATISAPVALSRSTDTLRLSWPSVANVRTYAIRVETADGPWFLFSDSTRFALPGTSRNFFAGGLPALWYPGFIQPLSVVAVDRNFYDYNRSGNDPFGGTGLISSVRGGLGLFGSVRMLVRRDVTVTDRDRVPLDARWVGTTGAGALTELDLWLETPGPTISSVSGRVLTTPGRFVVGTLEGDALRLITLNGISRADTLSVFTGRLSADAMTGSYNPRFAADGPTTWRRQPRR